MRSKCEKELFTKLSAVLAISLMLEKQKDCGSCVVACTNQTPAVTVNQQLKTMPITTDHDISINHVQILEKNVNNWQKRIFLESWHSTQDNNTVSE